MKTSSTDSIAGAYCSMAEQAKYRPAAPGDGFGNVHLDQAQIEDSGILLREADKYAKQFRREEDRRDFFIGCSCFDTVRSFVFCIEACRCLCAGGDFEETAQKLLEMAISELKATKQHK